MAKNTTITEMYENLPKLVKVLLQIFLGSLIGGVYRIIRFVETKNILTLVAGILNFVGLGFIFWIVDLITEIVSNRITVLAA
jgi:predicted amino acid racemase